MLSRLKEKRNWGNFGEYDAHRRLEEGNTGTTPQSKWEKLFVKSDVIFKGSIFSSKIFKNIMKIDFLLSFIKNFQNFSENICFSPKRAKI